MTDSGKDSHVVYAFVSVEQERTEWMGEATWKEGVWLPNRQSAPTEALREVTFVNRGGGALAGLLLGPFIGVASGALLGAAAGQDCSQHSEWCINRSGSAAIAGVLGGVFGLVLGPMIGAAVGHRTAIEFAGAVPGQVTTIAPVPPPPPAPPAAAPLSVEARRATENLPRSSAPSTNWDATVSCSPLPFAQAEQRCLARAGRLPSKLEIQARVRARWEAGEGRGPPVRLWSADAGGDGSRVAVDLGIGQPIQAAPGEAFFSLCIDAKGANDEPPCAAPGK